MPIFEYICQECNHRFELLVQGSTVPTCPSCKATKLQKQFRPSGLEPPQIGRHRAEQGPAIPAAIHEVLVPVRPINDRQGPGR